MSIRIALAQINTTVGDIDGNCDKILRFIKNARQRRAHVAVFPELALSGYPPEDLLLKKDFIKANRASLKKIIDASASILVIVGFPDSDKRGVYNAAAVIYNKRLIDVYRKIRLPNYGVFDEKRYFKPGEKVLIAPFGSGIRIAPSICEDIWPKHGPHEIASKSGKVNVIINISASPFHAGKILQRQRLLKERAASAKAFVCYCNAVGGQDELVFDGGSLIYGPGGRLIARARQFSEEMLIVDLDMSRPAAASGRVSRLMDPVEEVYQALVLGLKDYVRKNGFSKIVLGMSGGIDSALTAVIASEALGKENVVAVSMPSRFSSAETKKDSKAVAKNLKIGFLTIPINKVHQAYLVSLKKSFRGLKEDVTEENLQARIRGTLLMALSNKFGWLVVTTGNKSEISVGYCTLYGDTAGGFAVLKDVPKTLVYKLAGYVNEKKGFDVIPKSVIKRPPTAELKLNQKDQDRLPPYDILDKILEAYIEKDSSSAKMMRGGFNKKTVKEVVAMVDKSEYKRRQSPPGVKITPRAFGRDRRMPVVNKWEG